MVVYTQMAWGWVMTQGPVTNVDLWSTLMTLSDSTLAVWDWIKVPSRVEIQGNEKAHKLVEPAQPPPAPPTAEQAMIASLQRQIASLEGVINTLRRELAESRGEP